jgi:cathepsin X
MRKAQWPDINLSPQVLLSCDELDRGCSGGDPRNAYMWISEHNITDETCSPYQAHCHNTGVGCSAEIMCKNCLPGKGCWAQEKAKVYTVDEFGTLDTVEDMMNEIYQRGPITCEVAITSELKNYTSGIFVDKTGRTADDHVVTINGWGE